MLFTFTSIAIEKKVLSCQGPNDPRLGTGPRPIVNLTRIVSKTFAFLKSVEIFFIRWRSFPQNFYISNQLLFNFGKIPHTNTLLFDACLLERSY